MGEFVWAFPSQLAQQAHLTLPVQPTEVRVRVGEKVSLAQIHGFDLHIQELPELGKPRSRSRKWVMDRSSNWQLHCAEGQILAERSGPKSANQKKWVFHSTVSIQSPSGFLHFNGFPYREELRVYSIGNSCEVINHLDLEKYLEGLVNGEFSSKWKGEAIAAQVVAARTYGYYQILNARRNPNSRFDLDASVKDQVYRGPEREDFQASRIVSQTRGMVLTTGSGKLAPLPIKAFYHSTCGGMTEIPENVWGDSYPGLKRQVLCPYCKASPRFHWSLELKTSELEQLIRKGMQSKAETASLGSLVKLQSQEVDVSGRVQSLKCYWKPGSSLSPKASEVEIKLSAAQLRRWLGPERLRSTRFRLVVTDGEKAKSDRLWHFEGFGNGHGVGMCQWGAKIMAEKNFSMASILKHYYPDAILRKLW